MASRWWAFALYTPLIIIVWIIFTLGGTTHQFLQQSGSQQDTINDDKRGLGGFASPLVDNYQPETPLAESAYEEQGGFLLVHSWFEGKKLFTGYELLLKGFLVTQNLHKTKFIMWMTDDWSTAEDEAKRYIVAKYRHHPNIEFRMFDKLKLVKGTCWENRPEFIDKKTVKTYGMRDYSNVVRWLLLYNYGGVWLDADSIPLLDFTVLQEKYSSQLVAGYAPPSKADIAKANVDKKELGMFNNNFLIITDPKMRRKIMDVACLFRRKPLEAGERGYGGEPFVNVIPLVGEDKHEMYVMNHWLFNDGTLRYCWMLDDCQLHQLDLGSTDPMWVRTNDMYAMCERVIQSMQGYAASFTDLIQSHASGEFQGYIRSQKEEAHVWVVHNRLSHCRTAGTSPLGMSEWFGKLLDARLTNKDIMTAPMPAVDILAYDPLETKLPYFQIQFLPLLIVMESQPDDFQFRQTMRSMIYSKDWFPDLFPSMSRRFKLFFVIPYHAKHHDWNAKLHAEMYQFEDVSLVDPEDSSKPLPDDSLLSGNLNRGILKILNHFEARFVAILFGVPSSFPFVHVRNLYYFLNVASGRALFNKEWPIKSFIVTHKVNDAIEGQIQEKLKKENSTVFRATTPIGWNRNFKQQFVFFTRNNLATIMGVSEKDNGVQKGFQFLFTKEPQTAKDVLSRLPPHVARDHPLVKNDFVKGVEADTLEAIRFWGGQYGCPTMSPFLSKAKLSGDSNKCAFVPPSTDSKPSPLTGNESPDILNALLPMNITAVWNLPCRAAVSELRAAIETIPVLFIK